VHGAAPAPYARAVVTLLERTDELAVLESAARGAVDGRGATVAVTALAGLGKTRLVEAALDIAADHGLYSAHARAGELERDLGWGVALDVVEGLMRDLAPDRRAALLSGRARHASSVLADDFADGNARAAAARLPAIVAALTVLVQRLAVERPLAIMVDDVHWTDGPSLRWLCHLAARVDQTRVLLVVAFRSHEPGASELIADLGAVASETLVPAPLTSAATARLVDIALDHASDASTTAAVHEVTAGNPFLIDQLMRHLESGPVDASVVRHARPKRLAALVLPRLVRLGVEAKALSEALAVLGIDSSLRQAAQLAGLERSAAARAAERLAATGFFADSLPLNFAHPLLREVIMSGLSAAHADELRRSAARMLASGDSDPTEAGVHLLAAEPVGEVWAGSLLIAAGQNEMRRAAYDSAAAFFNRALLEPLGDVPRHSVTLYLGRAHLLAGRDEGLAALRQALADTPDQLERATVALEVGGALMAVDRPQQAVEVYDGGLSAIAELDESLRIHLLAQRALATLALRDQPARAITAVTAALEATSGRPEVDGRAAVGLKAIVAVWTGDPAPRCVELLEAALAAQPFGDTESLEWTPDLAWVMAALAWCDAHERREPFLDAVVERARERGAMLDLALAAASRSHGRMRQGRVADADEDARLARQIYVDLDDAHHAMVSAFQLDPLVARGALAEADALLVAAPPHRDDDQVVYLALLDARARLRIAQGRLPEARGDLELLRGEIAQLGFQCPAAVSWRPQLAVVLHGLGEHDRARTLAAEDVECARRFGAPRAYGIALLATAATNRPEVSLPALVEAAEVLEPSSARLEHARALIELGALMRRLGQRADAIQHLRNGLDRAASCGAGALVAAARAELVVAGARPRREHVRGPEALTAAERRVADLVATGAKNVDVAHSLVVSLRTVETHLTSVYRKLDIKRREQLANALRPEASPVAGGDDRELT
jgi:DNA-binding CsgD family transcriptional regulator